MRKGGSASGRDNAYNTAMNPAVLSLAAIVLYLFAACTLAVRVLRERAAAQPRTELYFIIAAAAVVIHGFVLYENVFTPQGLNVSVFNTASLVGWLVAILLLAVSAMRPVYTLLATLLPLSALALALEWLLGGAHVRALHGPKGIDLHVALSLVAYSVLTIAAFQAVLIAIADRQLRKRQPLTIMRALPPLAVMEALLFQLLAVGLLLLSLGLLSGFLFVQDLFAQHLVHKTVLSLLAWLVFALLLWGRRLRGWRGRTAVRYTLGGFFLLALGFFGSEVVLQLILKRV